MKVGISQTGEIRELQWIRWFNFVCLCTSKNTFLYLYSNYIDHLFSDGRACGPGLSTQTLLAAQIRRLIDNFGSQPHGPGFRFRFQDVRHSTALRPLACQTPNGLQPALCVEIQDGPYKTFIHRLCLSLHSLLLAASSSQSFRTSR